MGKPSIKKSLLEACESHLQENIDNLREAMEEAQRSANEYGQPKDRYDSYRAQLYRKRDMFALQLQKLLDQMEVLQKLDPDEPKSKVEFGALVITNKQKLFVSTSIGKLELEGKEYFVISPMVPFYEAMKDCKKGDSFSFRGNTFTIEDIL